MASPAKSCASTKQLHVVVVGGNCIREVIVGRDERYRICAVAHGFFDADQLIRQHRPGFSYS